MDATYEKPTERVAAAVIGAGPAGLAAAEALAAEGVAPVVFDAKPSAARKFLMAGKSGLNLTKNEPHEAFVEAIGCERLSPILAAFGPARAMEWAEALGEPLFTGSSGRVFPKAMKASPLLRRWLARLEAGGARLRTRWRWTGWEGRSLRFETPDEPRLVEAEATVLALGGASWPRLGSDAAWVPALRDAGVEVASFRPSNMGFDVDWSDHFRERFAGAPVKPAAISFRGETRRGEFVVTRAGVEGSLIYALSATLRDALEAGGAAPTLDLAPDLSEEEIRRRLSRPRGKASRATHLRKTLGISGVRAGLLRELSPDAATPEALAAAIKSTPLPLLRPRPIEEAISSAGGISWSGVDEKLSLKARPSVFVAGEMLDWDAPTGGYLVTACLATGFHAGRAAARLMGGAGRSSPLSSNIPAGGFDG